MLADFQQFYGVALPIDEDYLEEMPRFAILWQQLPTSSRLAKVHSKELEWSNEEYFLWLIEYNLRVLIWSLTGGKGSKQPKPLETPGERERNRQMALNTLANRQKINNILGFHEEVD